MKKFLLAIALLCLAGFSTKLFAWGRNGHDAIAYIAELNLKPDVKATVEGYLGGKSIVYFASWPDQIRFMHEYSLVYMDIPHTAKFSADMKSLGRDGSVKDGLWLIDHYMETLGGGKYKSAPDSLVRVAIQTLVHVVGDVHCPVHQSVEGRKESFNVTYDGSKMRFHKYWDNMPDREHSWSYMEYGHQLSRLTPDQVSEVTAGSVFDWGETSVRDNQPLWEYAEEDGELGKPYINKVMPVFDDIIVKAGYRLAYVLNYIFN